MKAVASPIIQAEMQDWLALGGSNSGIVGSYDGSHPTGFHRAGFEVPTSDYSRRHEPGRPYNLQWACAGDFSHGGTPALRARHVTLLGRLMGDDPALRMICEFIGQPWPGRPVYYWARWNGVKNLKKYAGKGHDHWSHISWWRSKANQRAFLWQAPAPVSTPTGGDVQLGDALTIPNYDRDPRWGPNGENSTVGTALGVASQRSYQAYKQTLELTAQVRQLSEQVQALRAAQPPAVGMTDEQVAVLAQALAARTDNRLTELDIPVLVAAFKQAAREGTGT